MEVTTPHNWSYLNFRNKNTDDIDSWKSIPWDSTFDDQLSNRPKKINWKMRNPLVPEPPQKKQIEVKDYLSE